MNRRSINWFFDILLPAFLVCWTVFLGYDALAGSSGYRALAALNVEAASKKAEVNALTARREHLDRIARQLSDHSLDADMLDEKVRSVLGFVEQGDVVIPRDQLDEIIRDARAKTR